MQNEWDINSKINMIEKILNWISNWYAEKFLSPVPWEEVPMPLRQLEEEYTNRYMGRFESILDEIEDSSRRQDEMLSRIYSNSLRDINAFNPGLNQVASIDIAPVYRHPETGRGYRIINTSLYNSRFGPNTPQNPGTSLTPNVEIISSGIIIVADRIAICPKCKKSVLVEKTDTHITCTNCGDEYEKTK